MKFPYNNCNRTYCKQQQLKDLIILHHEKFSVNCPIQNCEFSTAKHDRMKSHIIKVHKDLRKDVIYQHVMKIKDMKLLK